MRQKTMSRQKALASIRERPECSVLIVGAGVNGIGVFRELALQGVDVLLVDKSDFCAGTSAASSHMVHGGLKYLENGEFRLVREALAERNRLLQNAPHYVKPLPTTIPIFSWLSGILNAPLKFLNLLDRPGERGALVIKIGLTMYDLFTRGDRTLPTHQFRSRARSLEQYPHLNPKIICTATYYDAYMPCPERISLELVLDAEEVCAEALAVNYLIVDGASEGTVLLRDELSGEVFRVKPQIVINAAGPWIDFVNRSMGRVTAFIGGTKGSHLVVDCPELRQAIGDHEFYFENKDGRICLMLPFEDKVMVGSTDIRVDDPEQVQCTEEEVDYLLASVSLVFPGIKLDRSHIVFRFSGVRPLPKNDSVKEVDQITRDHSMEVVEPGNGVDFPIYSLVGGKWTTFRAFSEQVTDEVLARLGRPRRVHTRNMPIGGGENYPHTEDDRQRWLDRLQKKTGLQPERLELLFRRYGTRAEPIAEFLAAGPDSTLENHPAYSRREIAFLATQEKVVHLDDVILRRTLIGMLGQTSASLVKELADIVGDALGWSDERVRAEVQRVVRILREQHGVPLERLSVAWDTSTSSTVPAQGSN